MKRLKTSTLLLFFLTILLGIIYPMFMWGIGQLFFHKEVNGKLIYRDGKIVGSHLIAQSFTDPKYFHPRPSSAGKGYDATASSGSNWGPTSKKLIHTVWARKEVYAAENNWAGAIPADAVTGSGSGLDPHISIQNALIQAERVANARNLTVDQVRKLIDEHKEGLTLGLFGEPRVNVLEINLVLDRKTDLMRGSDLRKNLLR